MGTITTFIEMPSRFSISSTRGDPLSRMQRMTSLLDDIISSRDRLEVPRSRQSLRLDRHSRRSIRRIPGAIEIELLEEDENMVDQPAVRTRNTPNRHREIRPSLNGTNNQNRRKRIMKVEDIS